jgi:hypothetical protein
MRPCMIRSSRHAQPNCELQKREPKQLKRLDRKQNCTLGFRALSTCDAGRGGVLKR